MQRDNGAGAEPVSEKFLFHGTSRNAVDAICANNFDWRVCGSHGTVYGQGPFSYLITTLPDALYALLICQPVVCSSCSQLPLPPVVLVLQPLQ